MSLEFESLNDIAEAMTVKGKGILAADESSPTCKKRFDSIDVDSTEKNRNIYRDMSVSYTHLTLPTKRIV